MKNVLFVFISLLSLGLIAQNQWMPTGGPLGSFHIRQMVSSDSTEFADVGCAIFQRQTGGEWHKILENSASDMWVANDTLFVFSNYPLGLRYYPYKYSGTSKYAPSYVHPYNSLDIRDAYVTDSVKILMHDNKGIRYTYGLMDTSVAFEANLPFDTVSSGGYSLRNLDVSVFHDKVLLLTEKGLFSTTYKFDTWQPLDTTLKLSGGAKIFQMNNEIWIRQYKELWVSRDSGRSFTRNSTLNLPVSSMAYFKGDHYAATESGLYSSSDGGLHWAVAQNGVLGRSFGFIHQVGDQLYYSGDDHNFSRLSSSGWQPAFRQNLSCTIGPWLTSKNGQLFYSDIQAVYYQDSANFQWYTIFKPDSTNLIGDIQVVDTLLLIPYEQRVNGSNHYGIYYSHDEGSSWSDFDIPAQLGPWSRITIRGGNGGLIIAAGISMWFTNDLGQNIKDFSGNLTGRLPEIYDMQWHKGKLYTVSDKQNTMLIKSGQQWNSQINIAFAGGEGSLLYKWNENLLYFSGGGIFKLDSAGVFQPLSNGFQEVIDVASNQEHLMVYTDSEIYHTTDTGKTWADISPTSFLFGNIAVARDSLFCASFTGVYRYDLSFEPIGLASPAYPLESSPFSVYPNPYTEFIKVELHAQGTAAYELLQVNGQSIRRGEVASGASLNLSDTEPGIYILRLKLDSGWYQAKLRKL